MANPSPTNVPASTQLINGAKFVGDVAVMPGLGQIVEGNVGKGILYGVTGVLAHSFLGPLGWIAAGLDSYSVSSSGKHLWQLVGSNGGTPSSNIAKPE